MPFLVIRADQQTTLNSEEVHIMRYIALAQAWQDHGGKVNFLSHFESEILQQRIRSGTQAAGAGGFFSYGLIFSLRALCL